MNIGAHKRHCQCGLGRGAKIADNPSAPNMGADGGESILGRLVDQIEVNRSVISDRCERSAEGQLEEGIAPQVVVAVTGILPRDQHRRPGDRLRRW